jgi:protein-disulfide isomerase
MNQLKRNFGYILLMMITAVLTAACGVSGVETGGQLENGTEFSFVTEAESPRLADSRDVQSNTTGEAITPPTIEVAVSGDIETDAKGVQVGFTEDGRPYRGNPEATIIIEEFSDFQCPYCSRFAEQTLPGLEEAHIANGNVLFIYYDFPLTSIHAQAMAAANAAHCAGEQSAAAYWAMHDWLFMNPATWSIPDPNAAFAQFGTDLGLEMEQFTGCLESEKYFSQIEADLNLGVSRGVRSTPSFFINNQAVVGAQPLGTFMAAIETIREGGRLAAAEPAPPLATLPAPTPAAIALETAAGALGDPNAPVTIVEYTDYQCPYCSRHSVETMPLILSELIETGRVYYLLMDFPLEQIHPEATGAAAAARCAGDQDAYWQMHDALFAEQSEWSGLGATANAYYSELAGSLGLDADSFAACVENGRYLDAIQANLNEGLSLGIQGTPHFFIDGMPVSGARPYDLFVYAVGLAEEGILADAYVQQAPPPTPTPRGQVTVPEGDAFVLGSPDAPVTIVEYTDFQCPYCSRHFAQTFPLIKENYIDTGIVRYVFKDFPLTSIHPQATAAAEAARCAGDQDAYLAMHDTLFAQQEEWNGRSDAIDIFIGYAANLGLNGDAFTTCLQNGTYNDAVMADLEEGQQFGVSGTPAFFLNGYFVSGARPYDLFSQAIESLMNEQ